MALVVCSLDNPRGKAPRLSPLEGLTFINTCAKLHGWRVDSGLGCYRGEHEHCILIDGHGLNLVEGYQLDMLSNMLDACGQETLLFVDPRKRAQLVYLNDFRREFIGLWEEVDHELRPMLEAWTLVDHHLYTCR
jgi:hypothetical protein